jgi:single-stranded-DNA-specific exonuclease
MGRLRRQSWRPSGFAAAIRPLLVPLSHDFVPDLRRLSLVPGNSRRSVLAGSYGHRVPPSDVRLEVAPYDYAAAERLRSALGISHVTAQVLVRRGLARPARAREFLQADVRHPLDAFGGLREGAAAILAHVERGSRITVHGDYDVDGVSATAVLVRALRTLGADVDWYLPSRIDDGYGLALATVERLAARGTGLLVTVDCAITAVDEVAAARAAGLDVVVTDHHSPRADGRLPDAPVVHPAVGGYPCPELCAAGVAHLLARALLDAAGSDPGQADADLDLVALATVADCVPLVDENRRLVREGLRALASTRKPGLQALMEVARVDPSGIDAGAIGFRLAPRINAAGRLHRADAGLELLLTADVERARAVAAELDAVNAERRDVETRILFEAEKLVAESPPDARAFVLAADGWHPGVIGIVASRIAERHHRPAVLIALDGDEGTGSGRSIPAFDLLGGLRAASAELLRHGGHRAAAGLTIARGRVGAFRDAFVAHAAATLTPDDLVPVQRVDAVVPGDSLQIGLAEELERLAPFGMGNPEPALLVPSALLDDPRPMGEGRHVSFTLAAGGARSRCVAFGRGGSLPAAQGEPVDATVRLEVNRYNGAVEPRLVLSHAQPARPAPIEVVGEPDFGDALRAELRRDLTLALAEDLRGPTDGLGPPATRALRDARGGGIAGLLGDLVAGGGPVLAVTAHARQRAAALRDRVGGFAVTTWAALEDDPWLAARYAHVVAVDPPPHARLRALAEHLPGDGWTHLAWGGAELELARRVLAWELDLRPQLADVFRALRQAAAGGPPPAVADARVAAASTGSGANPPPAVADARVAAASPASGANPPPAVADARVAAASPASSASPPHTVADAERATASAPSAANPPTAVTGAELLAILRGTGAQPRSGTVAGRLLRVLSELGLIALETEPLAVTVPAAAARTELERSPAFRAYSERLSDGLAHLEEAERTGDRLPAAVAVA